MVISTYFTTYRHLTATMNFCTQGDTADAITHATVNLINVTEFQRTNLNPNFCAYFFTM